MHDVKAMPQVDAEDATPLLPPIRSAWRIPDRPQVKAARLETEAQRRGKRYENRVHKELLHLLALSPQIHKLEHNPWFAFSAEDSEGACSPDFVLHLNSGVIVCVEVKLTWVPAALEKLEHLYCPVIRRVYNETVFPLVIARHAAAGAPKPAFTVGAALTAPGRFMLWPDSGHIAW